METTMKAFIMLNSNRKGCNNIKIVFVHNMIYFTYIIVKRMMEKVKTYKVYLLKIDCAVKSQQF